MPTIENGETTVLQALQAGQKSKIVRFLLVACFLASCNSNELYQREKDIENEAWHKDSLVKFRPVIDDTSETVNIGFSLEYNNAYPYSNLWLFVDVESPDGHLQTDTIEYFLAEPDGEWIGKGTDRSRQLNWLYKGGVKMAQPGKYTFTLQQGMRHNELDGVQEVSLWIEKAENQKNSGEK